MEGIEATAAWRVLRLLQHGGRVLQNGGYIGLQQHEATIWIILDGLQW